MSEIEIYSYKICPFAQRTRMVLIEKAIPFTLTEIDLSKEKPAWFKDISPYGKVPLILHQGKRIYESTIINEYLDEIYPRPPLMPKDPYGRAQARIWMHYCDNYFLPAMSRVSRGKPEELEEAKTKLVEQLRFIDKEGLRKLSDEGPFFLGPDLSLVDIQFAPFFERFLAYDAAFDVRLPDDCARLKDWFSHVQGCKSYRETARGADFHLERYRRAVKAA